MCNQKNRADLLYYVPLVSGILGILGAITLWLLLVLGPIVEARYFPVTTGIKVELLKVENQVMHFQAYGTKVRQCALVDVKALVSKNGKVQKGAIWVINDGVGDKVRPLGYQDLGVWGIIPVSEKITIQGTYSCHPFWNITYTLGTWTSADKPVRAAP